MKININRYIPAAVILLSVPMISQGEEYFEYQLNALAAGYSWKAEQDYPYGNGNKDGKVYQLQYEHFDTNKWGRNWVDIESSFGKNMSGVEGRNHQYIAFVNPALSYNKITGSDFKFGPVTDVMLSYRYEDSNYGNFKSNGLGLLFTLNVPGFSYFETDYYVRDMSYKGNSQEGPNFMGRVFYKANTFDVGPIKINHMATFVYNKRRDGFGEEFFFRPDFFIPLNKKETVDVGLRFDIHSYSRPEFLGKGRETMITPRLMFRVYL